MRAVPALRFAVLASSIVMATAPAAAAQGGVGSIRGIVRNASTGAAIEAASIGVAGTSLAASSGAAGEFVIAGVPAGVHTVIASRYGFASREVSGVNVPVGLSVTVAIALRPSATDTTEYEVHDAVLTTAPPDRLPLALGTSELRMTPALSLAGILGVNGGYVRLPRSASTVSLSDIHRGVHEQASVRGARPSATLYLLDGVPVTNPVFGASPILLEPLAAGGVTVTAAYVDAEYGGALSGMVDQATRGASDRTTGMFEFLSSKIPGSLGSRVSAVSGAQALRGFLSGPVPGTGNRLGYLVAGHAIGERAAVRRDGPTGEWYGEGDGRQRQLVAKLSYAVRPTLQLSALALGDRRAAAGYDPNVLRGDTVAPPAVRDDRGLLLLRGERRFPRANVSLVFAHQWGDRNTCSVWQGVCVRDRLMRIPLDSSERPAFGAPRLTPYVMSGQYFGGESYRTNTLRADISASPGSGHRVRAGATATRHALEYADVMGYRYRLGTVVTEVDVYRTRPSELATYFQYAIEHDIVTVHFGARYDYRRYGGVALVNPLNPTNGTTALEVCNGEAPGLSDEPFVWGNLRGIAACMGSAGAGFGRPVLLDSATRLAQRDDFRPVRPQATFSPRVALSLPLTERSSMFLNVGRFHGFTPYHNSFRNFGTGSVAGETPEGDGMCDAHYTRPGTSECSPNLRLNRAVPEFVGNPDLKPEVATIVEAGVTTRAGRFHSVDVSVFNNAQGYLPRLYQLVFAPDIGVTYGVLSQGTQRVVLSTGSATSLGASVTVRRSRERVVTWSANYTWMRSQEIGATPDLVAEALVSGEPAADEIERVSSRGHAHSVSALIAWQWGEHTRPPLGVLGRVLLARSRSTVTAYAGGGGPEPQTVSGCLFASGQCAAFERGIRSTRVLTDGVYVRTLSSGSARVALVVRVKNLFGADDGSEDLRIRRVGGQLPGRRIPEQVARRRMMAGVSVDF